MEEGKMRGKHSTTNLAFINLDAEDVYFFSFQHIRTKIIISSATFSQKPDWRTKKIPFLINRLLVKTSLFQSITSLASPPSH